MFGAEPTALLAIAAGNPYLQFCAIVLGTFILEDATTVLATLQVCDGMVSPEIALGALYFGVAFGDFGLYGLGRIGERSPWIHRHVSGNKTDAARRFLARNLMTAVISVRFMPGMRLPTYTACGLLRLSFRRFALSVIIATLIWTSLLFLLSWEFGRLVLVHLGAWRWPMGLAMVLALIVFERILARRNAA